MKTLYEEDLAYVQAAGFGDFAAGAIAAILPRLRAAGVRRVIDVGCGAGVTTKALVEAGFETLAIEPSAPLAAIARAAAPGAELRQESMYETILPPCDAVLAIGEPLTYHAPGVDAEGRLRGFFREVGRALRPGGLFVFDVITTGEGSLDAKGWRAGDDWVVLYETKEERPERKLTRAIEIFRQAEDRLYRRSRETHHVRIFDAAALTAWLDREGFSVEVSTAYGDHALGPRRTAFMASRR
jgi:SAM-dependent methyltransferase